MIFIDIAAESSADASVAAIEPNVSSLIGLAGDLKGLLAVHCPRAVALGITSAMLGMEAAEIDEDVKDALGEVANMIAGGLKESLAADGRKIELAIPTTAVGTGIRTSGLSGATRVLVPFSSPLGRFGVELRFVLS